MELLGTKQVILGSNSKGYRRPRIGCLRHLNIQGLHGQLYGIGCETVV